MLVVFIGMNASLGESPQDIIDNFVEAFDAETTLEDYDSDPNPGAVFAGLHCKSLSSQVLAASLTGVLCSSFTDKTSPIRAPPRIALS